MRLYIVAVLTCLAVAGCSGSSSAPGATRQAGAPTTTPAPPATQPAQSDDSATAARAGFSVTAASLPPVAHRGEMVTATFNARPGTACQLQLEGGGNGAPLPPAVADPSGRVAWTWRLSPDADVGSLTAWVSCSGGARTQAQLNVA